MRSKKQAVVPRSSAKAEFQAFAHGVCYGIWLRRNGKELKLSIQERRCIVITRVLSAYQKNPIDHNTTKHVEIDRHFIKEEIENGIIQLIYVLTSPQPADILTKVPKH